MKYSIIMASYLGDYKGAAKDRETKFRRAVDSVLSQTHGDWELLVVADGCQRTVEICAEYTDPRIRCQMIPKQPLWSPHVRGIGIMGATGDWVVYLDTDDQIGPDHLSSLRPTNAMIWGYFNILEWTGRKWSEMVCDPKKKNRCGTANLIHRPGIFWPDAAKDYAHDWTFIQTLQGLGEGVKLSTPSYFNCHIPGRYDK